MNNPAHPDSLADEELRQAVILCLYPSPLPMGFDVDEEKIQRLVRFIQFQTDQARSQTIDAAIACKPKKPKRHGHMVDMGDGTQVSFGTDYEFGFDRACNEYTAALSKLKGES